MSLMEFYMLLKSVWTLWFALLFVGIVAWAFWPTRANRLQDHANIPLRED